MKHQPACVVKPPALIKDARVRWLIQKCARRARLPGLVIDRWWAPIMKTDFEPAPCSDQDDRDALQAVQPVGAGHDPGRAVRDDGLAPQQRSSEVRNGAPTGKRLAPVIAGLVDTLWRFGELDVSDELVGALGSPRRTPWSCSRSSWSSQESD